MEYSIINENKLSRTGYILCYVSNPPKKVELPEPENEEDKEFEAVNINNNKSGNNYNAYSENFLSSNNDVNSESLKQKKLISSKEQTKVIERKKQVLP